MLQKQPWHKLSQLLGARGVKVDWTGFPENLLKPTNELAETHPCAGQMWGIHGRGQTQRWPAYVGVCASGCDKRVVAKERSDRSLAQTLPPIFSGLGQAFISAMAWRTQIINGITACWQIGDYNPVRQLSFPCGSNVD
jgi:hypothetical protein